MVGKIKRVRHKLHQDAVKVKTGQERASYSLERAPVFLGNITATKAGAHAPADHNKPGEGKVSVGLHLQLIHHVEQERTPSAFSSILSYTTVCVCIYVYVCACVCLYVYI